MSGFRILQECGQIPTGWHVQALNVGHRELMSRQPDIGADCFVPDTACASEFHYVYADTKDWLCDFP